MYIDIYYNKVILGQGLSVNALHTYCTKDEYIYWGCDGILGTQTLNPQPVIQASTKAKCSGSGTKAMTKVARDCETTFGKESPHDRNIPEHHKLQKWS